MHPEDSDFREYDQSVLQDGEQGRTGSQGGCVTILLGAVLGVAVGM